MKFQLKRTYDVNDPMWIVGCVDSYGAITARVVNSFGNLMHTKEESRGKRWRWNIWGQEFHCTRNPTLDRMTDEEYQIVSNWLEERGYKKATQ